MGIAGVAEEEVVEDEVADVVRAMVHLTGIGRIWMVGMVVSVVVGMVVGVVEEVVGVVGGVVGVVAGGKMVAEDRKCACQMKNLKHIPRDPHMMF